jgi:hypothetical protein
MLVSLTVSQSRPDCLCSFLTDGFLRPPKLPRERRRVIVISLDINDRSSDRFRVIVFLAEVLPHDLIKPIKFVGVAALLFVLAP